MSEDFACYLWGKQRLQVWRCYTNAWYQDEYLWPLCPAEMRLYYRGNPRAAGFPYSPYLSGQVGQDWLNAVQRQQLTERS